MKKKLLCTICMRGGSKGVINKHTKIINGKPLLFYTINQAVKSKIIDEVIVSSDSKKILKLSGIFGVKNLIRRPKYLASDKAPKIPTIRHALIQAEKLCKKKFDYILDLPVTSPLRTPKDIVEAFKLFIKRRAKILISGSPSRKNPYFNMVEKKNFKVRLIKRRSKSFFRRQDAPKVYDLNDSIYIWRKKTLLNKNDIFSDKTILFTMPNQRSIDIDNKTDFKIVEFFLKKKKLIT